MKLSEQPAQTAPKRRLGRGSASGRGTTSGRGTKGQNARTGGGVRPGFEGGQMPLVMRTPKRRGFRSRRPQTVAFNFDRFSEVPAGTVVTVAWLKEEGWIGSEKTPVKLLGDGDVPAGVTFDLPSYSKSALAKLSQSGARAKPKAVPKPKPAASSQESEVSETSSAPDSSEVS